MSAPVLDRDRSARLEELATGARLSLVGRRPGLGTYLQRLWGRRSFLAAMAAGRLRAKNASDRLGVLWLALTPLLAGAAYYLVFGVVLDTRDGVENFVGFLIIGIFFFQYTARGILEGSKSVTSNRKLIQALAFPRAVLPISTVLRQAWEFLPALGIMLAIIAFTDPVLSWRWALLPVLVLMVTVFNLGAVLLTARLTAHVSDVTNVLPFLTRIWLYTSGVFFSFEDRFDDPTALALVQANPMHVYLTLVRDSLLYGETSPPSYWLTGAAWALVLLVVGFVVFWAAEEKYTRD
ncbi:ABC transporter permease [Aquipuribacter sp. SD81]|uniref:ABC transporter permease n=1 Tax=Aquipuribacter sp. SD81 TaxID=3127703 RepID=UPI00301A6365